MTKHHDNPRRTDQTRLRSQSSKSLGLFFLQHPPIHSRSANMAVMSTTKFETGQENPAAWGALMKLARSAGALYLINIVGGAFAISIIPALLFGSDFATT